MIELIQGERAIGLMILNRELGRHRGFEDRRQLQLPDACAGGRGGAGGLLHRGLHVRARLRPPMRSHHCDRGRGGIEPVDAQVPSGDGGGRECDVGDAGRGTSPAVSSDQAKAFIPTVGSSRNEGLNPAIPQNAAGRITEPAVWLPSAIGTMPPATAAADPEDDPPGVCAGLRGLRVLAGCRLASSVVTVLPSTRPPARRNSATAAAWPAFGRWPA